MTGLRITAKTEAGSAIMNKIALSDTADNDNWKRFLKEEVRNTEPYDVVITYRKVVAKLILPPARLEEVIVGQMTSLGLVLGVDFEVNRV